MAAYGWQLDHSGVPTYSVWHDFTACSPDAAEKNFPSGENAKVLVTMHPFGFLSDSKNAELTRGGMGDSFLSIS